MTADRHVQGSDQKRARDSSDVPAGSGWQEHLRPAVDAALEALNRPGGLTILVNDPQRHTDSPAVLSCLARHVDPTACRILVATGSHCFNPQEQSAHEGQLSASLPGAPVAWHDCRSVELVPVRRGRWRCHPWLPEDRPVLAVGSVEPHYFAGFTGAHKTATIGCAAFEDIQANHAAALSADARPGVLSGNPVHEGVLEMLNDLRQVQELAAVNLVQAGREILAAAGGAPMAALGAVQSAAERAFIRRIESPVDAVVAEVTGPLAASLYQADKGIKNNEWAVRDGGVLVLSAPCPSGIGQRQFLDLLQEAPTYQCALDIVRRRGYRLGDHKAVKLRYLTDPAGRNVEVHIVSEGITSAEAEVLGFVKSASVAEALAQAAGRRRCENLLHVPDAGNMCLLPRSLP